MNIPLQELTRLAAEKPIPVLRSTIEQVRRLCNKDDIPIKEITHVLERDPGSVLHILNKVKQRGTSRLQSEITFINQALRLMGTSQISAIPNELPAIDDTLDKTQQVRLLKTYARAYHAARQATDWAVKRRDMTPDEVFTATELQFLGEIILALHRPELLDQIDKVRREDHIASEEAQYLVLGFTLTEFTLQLAKQWQLPPLALEALQPENAQQPRAYGVMLGVQLARAAALDWHGEKTQLILEKTAEWLGWEKDNIIAGSHQLAVEVAREIEHFEVTPAAAWLPIIHKPAMPQAKQPTASTTNTQQVASDKTAAVCFIPQLPVLRTIMQNMAKFSPKQHTGSDFIKFIVQSMHDGLGLNRVVFAAYDAETNSLRGKYIKGAENDPIFNRFQIKLGNNSLFDLLVSKPQAILLNGSTREKFWPMVPPEVQKLIKTNSFVAMSVFADNKLAGVFYADRHTPACQLDDKSYHYFKILCTHTGKALTQLPNR